MTDTWQVASEEELLQGELFAEQICSENFSADEICQALRNIPRRTDNSKIEWKIPFAGERVSISNNVIAQTACSISARKGWDKDNGVVLTPNILAEDMVRVSLAEWLARNTRYHKKEMVDFVYLGKGNGELREICKGIRWYDPCVGGGVYPLSVMTVYKELGILETPVIFGYDINPLYVEATITRMALSAGENHRSEFEKRILCGDALDTGIQDNFDIVIGNPPYVKGSAIEKSTKKKYLSNYPELGGKSTDIYIFFICHGLAVLKESGILTFITPAQFQMSNYGKPVRKMLQEKGELCLIADFNEQPVFKNVSVHTSVYCISKEKRESDFVRYEYKKLPENKPLRLLYKSGFMLPQKNITEAGWIFSSADAVSILDYLDEIGTPLKDCTEGVFSGIKCGCKKAFFMKVQDTYGFDRYDWNYCVKMILPREMKAWKSEWTEDYLVLIKQDEVLDEKSSIYKRMLSHKNALKARTDAAEGKAWYSLRKCGYYDKFEAPKIIYPDISTECRFSMERDGLFIPDGAFFIPGENYYLLGVLNSCVGRYYFQQRCARIGNPKMGGRIRFKKVYVENFPLAPAESDKKTADMIAAIARKAYTESDITEDEKARLDRLVMEMYRLPGEMRKVIQET